jgi:hypothetical protein
MDPALQNGAILVDRPLNSSTVHSTSFLPIEGLRPDNSSKEHNLEGAQDPVQIETRLEGVTVSPAALSELDSKAAEAVGILDERAEEHPIERFVLDNNRIEIGVQVRAAFSFETFGVGNMLGTHFSQHQSMRGDSTSVFDSGCQESSSLAYSTFQVFALLQCHTFLAS